MWLVWEGVWWLCGQQTRKEEGQWEEEMGGQWLSGKGEGGGGWLWRNEKGGRGRVGEGGEGERKGVGKKASI